MQNQAQQYIQFNQDFTKVTIVKNNQTSLQPTPMKGVKRLILQRRGDQVARRATSIVSYEPQSSFKAHTHHYGQQYYVLQGVFSDHTGHFSKGFYVRNGVKSSHAPFSKQGTRIFVKLAQFPINQTQQLILDTNSLDYEPISQNQSVSQLILYQSQVQSVSLYKFAAGSQYLQKAYTDIVEIFVIDGEISVLGQTIGRQSWIRIPKGVQFVIKANLQSKIYCKLGKGIVRDKQYNQIKIE